MKAFHKPPRDNFLFSVLSRRNKQRITPKTDLPVQFQRELELARVVGRGGLTGVGEERAYGCDVVAVSNVEHVGDEIHVDALAEVNAFGEAHIVEGRPRGNARVAAEAAVEQAHGVGAGQLSLL